MLLTRRFVLLASIALPPLLSCGGSGDVAGDVERSVVLREGGCRSCRIIVDTIAVLGEERDTLAIEEGATPAMDSRGRIYIIEKGGSSILVFGPDGSFMQSFGRGGVGPGEFRRLSELHAYPGDTLIALGSGVVHVISPEYEHIRQVTASEVMEAGFFNTMLSDGRIVRLAGPNKLSLLTIEGTAAPAVLLEGSDSTSCVECGLRLFREGKQPGTVWSTPQSAYRAEQHDLTGKLLRRFVRHATWFPEWTERREDRAMDLLAELTKVRGFGVRETDDGLVWVHVVSVDAPASIAGFMPSDIAEANRVLAQLFEKVITTVEVFDPETGRVLAVREFNALTVPMTGEYAAQMAMDEYGDWRCRVLRLRVEGRSGSEPRGGGN